MQVQSTVPAPSLSLYCRRPLYFMTHVDNLPSVLEFGILAYNRMQQLGLGAVRIDNRQVQDLRGRVVVVDDGVRRPLHDYVPLYFAVRSPMLSDRRRVQDQIVYVEIDPTVLDLTQVVLSNGNAARQGLREGSAEQVEVLVVRGDGKSPRQYIPRRLAADSPLSDLYAGVDGLNGVSWSDVDSESWGGDEGKKNRKEAEALVPGRVVPAFFRCLHVRRAELAVRVGAMVYEASSHLPVRVTPEYYFPDFVIGVDNRPPDLSRVTARMMPHARPTLSSGIRRDCPAASDTTAHEAATQREAFC